MHVRYDGPEGQASYQVGDATGGSSILEPGRVYDLPTGLAEGLLESSQHWARVSDYSKLTDQQLRDVARDRGIEGYSKLKKDELLAAVRGADTGGGEA